MESNSPKTIAGKIYPEFALSLVVSPLLKSNPDFLSASVVLKLSPMRRENGTIEVLNEPEHQVTLVVSDAFLHNDMDFMQALGTVQFGVQQYINAKNL